jgi:hypothetical protein
MVRDSTEAVFFYCSPAGPPEKAAYQHAIVCLGEGLKELGIPFYSNIDYWRISANDDEHLFCSAPAVTPHDCSVVVVTDAWFTYGKPFPDSLFQPHREYVTVYLDSADAHRTLACSPEFRQFDIILRAHYNSRCRYPSNIHPWAFGLSNRILQESDGLTAFHDRKRSLLVNYRVRHPVRDVVRKEFLSRIQNILPVDDSIDSFDEPPTESYHHLQWTQTGRRHYPHYYRRLQESAACACFGGVFVPLWPRDTFASLTFWDRSLNKLWRVWQRTLKKLGSHPKRIGQWDSYRFWESLALGCVAFHVDLEKYGCLPPVMPENWRHYVGIDLDNPQEAVDRISEDRDTLQRISVEGQHWALENYSPVRVAERFLQIVGRGLP